MDIQTGPDTSPLMTATSLTTPFSRVSLILFFIARSQPMLVCIGLSPAYRCIYVYHTYAYTQARPICPFPVLE